MRAFVMPLWDDFERVNAAAFADKIVKRAIEFASEVPLPDSAAMRPNSNTLVSKHVEAQLAYFETNSSERQVVALEELAKVLVNGSVTVKTAQPWHKHE